MGLSALGVFFFSFIFFLRFFLLLLVGWLVKVNEEVWCISLVRLFLHLHVIMLTSSDSFSPRDRQARRMRSTI